MAALVALDMLNYQTKSSIYGFLIILTGVPAYFIFKKSKAIT